MRPQELDVDFEATRFNDTGPYKSGKGGYELVSNDQLTAGEITEYK